MSIQLKLRSAALQISKRPSTCPVGHHETIPPRLLPRFRYQLLYSKHAFETIDKQATLQSLLGLVSRRSTLKPVMVSVIQTREHGGHSHDHHGGGELLASKDKKDAAVRIAWVGLYSNVLMVVAKGLGGFFLNSRTMISDALHAVTDLASDILTLAAVSFAARPPTPNNPVGFGKIESMGSVVVSGLLFTGGAFMGLDAISSLWELWLPEAAAHSHDHSHGGPLGLLHHHHGTSDLPNIHAAWIALGSIAIKEWVYRKTIKVAEERKSSVLRSSAIHHRADSWTSMVSLVTILSTHLLGGVQSIDPLGSLMVSTVVLRAGFQNLVSAVKELSDRTIDDEVKKSVRDAAIVAVRDAAPSIGKQAEDVSLQMVQGVKSGPNNLVEVAIAVPGSWSVDETIVLEQAVRDCVGAKVRGARRVKITFAPKELELPAFTREYIDPNTHSHPVPSAGSRSSRGVRANKDKKAN